MRVRLNDTVACAAPPQAHEYAIHDTALQGFMLRVRPSGARSWVLRVRHDGNSRRVTLGSVAALTAKQARTAAHAVLAHIERGGTLESASFLGPTLLEFAHEYLERRSQAWKPSTRQMLETYLSSAILPALGEISIGTAARVDVAPWFHAYGRSSPGGANRCHAILRDMFSRAVDWGYRSESAGNPCHGIMCYQRPPRGRLLGTEDLARLGATLRDLESTYPIHVAVVRLILLTGCRPGEIRRLRWEEVKSDRLLLGDSKTGPRTVLLGEAARELLSDLASKTDREWNGGEWVFPSTPAGEPLKECVLYHFWTRVRSAASLVADARLYDLRHTHASHAVMNGESLYMTGRLLGHRNPTTTHRYAHLDDATLSAAAERIGAEMQRRLTPVGPLESPEPTDTPDTARVGNKVAASARPERTMSATFGSGASMGGRGELRSTSTSTGRLEP
ncbi:MAG: site-specific integrase [Thiotrichales bacterium]|nr:site-specific integrase [Thiotrichales bacterium]MCY4348346.1 site-specific integrase [Thiotrichales bacterium]